jgi:hypothetical protein
MLHTVTRCDSIYTWKAITLFTDRKEKVKIMTVLLQRKTGSATDTYLRELEWYGYRVTAHVYTYNSFDTVDPYFNHCLRMYLWDEDEEETEFEKFEYKTECLNPMIVNADFEETVKEWCMKHCTDIDEDTEDEYTDEPYRYLNPRRNSEENPWIDRYEEDKINGDR